MGAELFEPHGPVGNKLLVIQPLVQNDLEPSEHHHRIGHGLERQPQIGHICIVGLARIQNDKLGTPFAGALDSPAFDVNVHVSIDVTRCAQNSLFLHWNLPRKLLYFLYLSKKSNANVTDSDARAVAPQH